MAHGVEGRYPVPRPPGLRACRARCRAERKLDGLRDKVALRELAARLLPAAIADAAKQPYRAPEVAPFFGADAPDWVEELLSRRGARARRASGTRAGRGPACAAAAPGGRDRRARGDGARRRALDPALASRLHRRRAAELPGGDGRAAGQDRSHGSARRRRQCMSDGLQRACASEMRAFIEENFLYMQPDVELATTTSCWRSGSIDSLGFVELVEEVQARYGIAVEDVEITEENFGSIDAIAALRRAQASADLSAPHARRGPAPRGARATPTASRSSPPRATLSYAELDALAPTARRGPARAGRRARRPGRGRAAERRSTRSSRSTASLRAGRGVLAAQPDGQARQARARSSPTRAAAVVICDAERARGGRGARPAPARGDGRRRSVASSATTERAPDAVGAAVESTSLRSSTPRARPGEPKGVTLTHRNMTFVADSIIEYLGAERRRPDPLRAAALVRLRPLPAADVRAGRRDAGAEPGFAFPGRVVELLEDERITVLPGVPTVFQVLISLEGLGRARAAATCASSPTPAPRCPRRRSAQSARPSRRRSCTPCTG